MRPLEVGIVFVSLLGAGCALASLGFLLVLWMHQRERMTLKYDAVRWLRSSVITTMSVLAGLLLAGGGDCCCYQFVVPCLRGYSQDANRTVMYWFHRHVFAPLGLYTGQEGWKRGMELTQQVPIILGVVFFVVGWVLARWWLRRALRVDPRDWLPKCPYCLYNLTGNVSGVCPECGQKVPGRSGGGEK